MNKTVKQKQSKSMDMQFYWLQDRVKQRQFRIFWAPGKINLADYQSKVQPTSVHKAVCPIYLYVEGKSPTTLQGCDKILESLASGTSAVNSRYLTAFMLWPSINGHILGVYFFGGISPSKIGHIAPFLATIQALSKTRVFLLSKKKRRLLCMGRTFTANKPSSYSMKRTVERQLGIESGSCKS
jgi:hypothetical protein